MMIRAQPDSWWSKPQLVLLDHGLYVSCSDEFRHDYALFWKSLFSMDEATVRRIGGNWGIRDIPLFASAVLQKTWLPGKAVHVDTNYMISDVIDSQLNAKAKLQNFLKESQDVPWELLFIGRNMK